MFLAVFLTGMYGLGTLAGLLGSSNPLASSVVPQIRRDAARVEVLEKAAALAPQNPLFTVDYTLAAQLRYYTDRPAYTSWGQYKIWGYPEFRDVTLLSLEYLSIEEIDGKLREAFSSVDGPFQLTPPGEDLPAIFGWKAEGLNWKQDRFLEAFDLMNLLEAGHEKSRD